MAQLTALRPFDYFIAVDWSSRAKPSPRKPARDAIWVAQAPAGGRTSVRYFRTREECTRYLEKRLVALLKKGKRVFIGWDFCFGYPKGLAKALRLKKDQPWLRIWERLSTLMRDRTDNRNNRFIVAGELNQKISMGSGPFWGVPAGQSGIFLGTKKDFTYPVVNKRAMLRERRLVEKRVRKMQPAWKLAYVGSVGSQTMLGIPRVLELTFAHEKLAKHSHVWPFSTAFDQNIPESGPCILHSEIYPSMLKLTGKDKIPDREQVKTYVTWLAKEQSAGRLINYLKGPQDLSGKERKRVLKHEGWVFGIK